jgi:replicative DNA helicase
MKTRMIIGLLAVCLSGALPVMAAEMTQEQTMMRMCALEAETIQMKIHRLEKEVASGQAKMNMDDLKKLEGKLEEAKKIMESLTAH